MCVHVCLRVSMFVYGVCKCVGARERAYVNVQVCISVAPLACVG